MEHCNRTNDRHPFSPNLLPSSGGIPAAGRARLVMEGSSCSCLDDGYHCRQHGWPSSGHSRLSPLLIHLRALHWPFNVLRAGSEGMMWPSISISIVSFALASNSCSSARPSRTEERLMKSIKGRSSSSKEFLPPSSFPITPQLANFYRLTSHTRS